MAVLELQRARARSALPCHERRRPATGSRPATAARRARSRRAECARSRGFDDAAARRSMRRSGDAKTSASGSCTMRTVSPRSGELRRPSRLRVELGRAGDRQHAVAGAACRIDRKRAAFAARRRRLIPSTTSPQRGTSMRPSGEGGAAVDRRLGDRAADAEVDGRSRPRRCSSSGDNSARNADVGPLDAHGAVHARVARAHVGDLGVDVGAAAAPFCARAAVSARRPLRQRHARLHEVELRRERALVGRKRRWPA